MPLAINPEQTFDYILKADRELDDGDPAKTTFHLRVLTVKELAKVEDDLAAYKAGEDEVRIKSGSQAVTILKLGLTGWSNFNEANPDHPGDEDSDIPKYRAVPFKGESASMGSHRKDRKQPTDGDLDRLTPADRRELANAITEQNRLTEDEKGN